MKNSFICNVILNTRQATHLPSSPIACLYVKEILNEACYIVISVIQEPTISILYARQLRLRRHRSFQMIVISPICGLYMIYNLLFLFSLKKT